LKPRWVHQEAEAVTEIVLTFSGLGQEAIYRYTDTYTPGTYRFKSDRKQIAIGPGGYVF
jgi:hypothetical protein